MTLRTIDKIVITLCIIVVLIVSLTSCVSYERPPFKIIAINKPSNGKSGDLVVKDANGRIIVTTGYRNPYTRAIIATYKVGDTIR